MEIKEWDYLLAIAEEKSISKAARRLYMAQSSLSQFLGNLEAELGCPLFVRTSTGVRLTESGRELLAYAHRAVSEYRELRERLQDINALKSGQVVMGISSFRGSYLMPPVLNAFHLDYPNIHVRLVEAHSMALEQKLMSGDIDLAMLVIPVQDERIPIEFLMKDEICIITNESHPLMEHVRTKENIGQSRLKRQVSIRDAARYEFLLSDYDTVLGREARELFRSQKLVPITYNDTLSALFAASMGASGQGLAFTYYSSRHYFRNAEFLSLGKSAPSISLGLAMPPGRYHSRATLALKDTFFKILGE